MKSARNRSVSTPHNAGESFLSSRIRGRRFIFFAPNEARSLRSGCFYGAPGSEAKRGRILLYSAAPFNRRAFAFPGDLHVGISPLRSSGEFSFSRSEEHTSEL